MRESGERGRRRPYRTVRTTTTRKSEVLGPRSRRCWLVGSGDRWGSAVLAITIAEPATRLISTGDPVLPGARGRVDVSESAGSTRVGGALVGQCCRSNRYADSTELRQRLAGHRTVAVPRRGSASPCASTPASSRTWQVLSGENGHAPEARPSPALDLAAGRSRRRLQEPSSLSAKGSRRHAVLGVLARTTVFRRAGPPGTETAGAARLVAWTRRSRPLKTLSPPRLLLPCAPRARAFARDRHDSDGRVTGTTRHSRSDRVRRATVCYSGVRPGAGSVPLTGSGRPAGASMPQAPPPQSDACLTLPKSVDRPGADQAADAGEH